MQSTYALCRAIQRRHKIPSDYALAKMMKVTRQTASKWVNKKAFFSDENAIQCARLLSLSPAYVLACTRFEKAKSPEARAAWRLMAENAPDIDIVSAA